MKMKAPEGTSSAAVENDQYEVDEHGEITVENGEHIPQLELHGFVQVPDHEGATASEPVDEVGPCPDFSKFVNRQALVDYLVAHENSDHTADEKRADLEAACAAQHALLVAGEARRVHPEGDEQPEEKSEDETVDETDETKDEESEGEGEGETDAEAEAE